MGALDEHPALTEGLACAVPLRIAELMQLPERARTVAAQQWSAAAVGQVASRGDALQYGGKSGRAAAVFNALARGLAALAMCPGGVTFAGRHWCVEHLWGVSAPERVVSCSRSGLSDPGRPVTDTRPVIDTRPL